jgi:hypothetical protein
MKRVQENIKEFQNGNLSIRFPVEYRDKLKRGVLSSIEVISWVLEELDCYFIGDEFCLSNYEMGAMIYNCYSDLMYIINFNDIENILASGRWLRLYARIPDTNDREIINERRA